MKIGLIGAGAIAHFLLEEINGKQGKKTCELQMFL